MEISAFHMTYISIIMTLWEILTFIIFQALVVTKAFRIVMLDVPSPTILGESVELTCSYELDDEQLYSVKWYKNDVEFYRYVPNDWPPGQFLPLPGIRVDLSKSGKNSVYLRHVDLNSGGLYRCEISAEAPSFDTAEAEKEMKVYVLPSEGPTLTGGNQEYRIGDTVIVNCTSAKSKPAATLRWYINDELVGPEYETEYSTTLHADGLETSSLGLKFIVTSQHFQNGNMKLKCTATISRIYTMSNEEMVFGGRQQTSGLHISENMSRMRDSASQNPAVRWTVALLASCCLLLYKS
ncbi:cell adhesion molecule 2 isoform X2 [Parasteatoda tepidariorum]|uniref:cell adhesion molecule 2 isoform X2 n=1 Tax=Parasteatoda tepidariorum TaxID=114398 RepID=UPI00077FD07C|nr:cell adhesion molecule 2 isoform X2 [Parasteatoda tepidariorum]